MKATLRNEVIRRAGGCCEYCGLPQEYYDIIHEIDHIIARKHKGSSTPTNLALA